MQVLILLFIAAAALYLIYHRKDLKKLDICNRVFMDRCDLYDKFRELARDSRMTETKWREWLPVARFSDAQMKQWRPELKFEPLEVFILREINPDYPDKTAAEK